MKKTKCLYISLYLFTAAFIMTSCLRGKGDVVIKKIEVEPFYGIANNISADIHIRQAPTHSLEIIAQQNIIDNISLKVNNGILEIKFKKKASHYDDININISMPRLSSFYLNGSGNMNTINAFDSCGTVLMNISGSGNINASFNSSVKTHSTISGSGNITLNGSSTNHNIVISGSGNVKSFNFGTYYSVVNISGSGNCELAVDSTLNVTISGSGNVYYKGHPSIINSTITGSGTIYNSN